jgi:dihydrofolate reductase
MSVSLIAAVADNGCIGKKNQLPWYLPEDLKRFKQLTTGKVVLMGRRTWESLPEKFRPLPNRTNVVITRQPNFTVPAGVEVYPDITAALQKHSGDELFIIGGAEIYKQTIGAADTLFITEVHQTIDGDAFFPTIDKAAWKETSRENFAGFSFVTYSKL